MIAEGAMPAQSEADYIQAWQTLVDSGAAWELQGFFGRTARDLLVAGHLRGPKEPPFAENTMSKNNFDNLMRLLGDTDHRKIENDPFMPLTVERLEGTPLVSLCHYGEQNGDLMCDPEVVFVVREGRATPVYFRNDYAHVEHATVDGHFGDVPVKPWLQKSLDSFCRDWWQNIKEQGFFEKARELAAKRTAEQENQALATPDADVEPEP
jgi:hypothetical protein